MYNDGHNRLTVDYTQVHPTRDKGKGVSENEAIKLKANNQQRGQQSLNDEKYY